MTIEGFKRGDQVRFSEKGLRIYNRNKNRIGEVVNNPDHPRCKDLYVRWAGNLSYDEFHPAYIEKIEAPDWPSLCADVCAQFKETLAYLGEME